MKESVNKLVPSASYYVTQNSNLHMCNSPAVNTIAVITINMHDVFACILLHL